MDSIVVVCGECAVKNRISTRKMHYQPKCGKCKALIDVRDHVVPVSLTDTTMDDFVKNSTLPVLVDFFSPTCGPCRTLAPHLEKMARQYFRKVIVATVDTSHNPGCSAFYKIRGVPTLIFFKSGKVVDQITGLPDISLLEAKLNYLSLGS